jgi:hypothetical protein
MILILLQSSITFCCSEIACESSRRIFLLANLGFPRTVHFQFVVEIRDRRKAKLVVECTMREFCNLRHVGEVHHVLANSKKWLLMILVHRSS